MSSKTDLWAVVATVREPLPLLQAFALHHLALGATEVHLCFDDPDDAAADVMAAMPGVCVHRCDAAHWGALGGRPRLQTGRQLRNATWVADQARADWLLHCDADEFLSLRRPLREDLARLATGDLWLKIPVAERVWVAGQPATGVFDGAFRRPLGRDGADVARIYGSRRLPFLDSGLAGHAAGKGLSRLRVGLEIAVHHPRLRGENAIPPGISAWFATLLHFDGLTPQHWCDKTRRYADHDDDTLAVLQHPGRRRQIEHIRQIAAEDALAFHADLFRLTLDEAAALDAMEALHFARIGDPGSFAARLTASQFDQAWAKRKV